MFWLPSTVSTTFLFASKKKKTDMENKQEGAAALALRGREIAAKVTGRYGKQQQKEKKIE